MKSLDIDLVVVALCPKLLLPVSWTRYSVFVLYSVSRRTGSPDYFCHRI